MTSRAEGTALPAAGGRAVLVTYLASDLLSLLGNAVVVVVLPLLVLSRTGSPAAAGVVLAAGTVPAIVAGVLGGALVDRYDRRRVSMAADLVSAASVAALPVVDALWGLDLGWFVALGAVGAFGDLPGMTAREALAPAVSARCGLPVDRLVAVREALGAAVMIVGPGLAGALIWLMPEQAVLWVTAATSAAAALATAALPASLGSYERADAAAPRIAGAVRHSLDGFRLLAGDPVLRALVGLTIVGAAAIACLQGLLLPVHFAALGRPELLGTVLVALATGLLAGAAGYAALAARLSPPAWFRLGLAVSLVGMVGVAALPGLVPLLASAALAGLGAGPTGAVGAAVVIARIHEGRLGRAMGAQNALVLAALPLVALPTGALAEAASPRAAGLALASLVVLAAVVSLSSRALRAWSAGARAEAGGAGS